MSFQQSSISNSAPPTANSTIYRHGGMCFIWMTLLVVDALVMLAFTHSPAIATVGIVAFFYVLQALLAEVAGLRLDEAQFSAPRRPTRLLPLLTMWRETVPLHRIAELCFMPKIYGLENAIVKLGSGASIALLFSDREQKLSFLQSVKRNCPEIAVYRKG